MECNKRNLSFTTYWRTVHSGVWEGIDARRADVVALPLRSTQFHLNAHLQKMAVSCSGGTREHRWTVRAAFRRVNALVLASSERRFRLSRVIYIKRQAAHGRIDLQRAFERTASLIASIRPTISVY